MRAHFFTPFAPPGPGDTAPWAHQVAAAVVHDASEASLVTYAGVRAFWLRRTFADVEARTALSALCAAATSPARRPF